MQQYKEVLLGLAEQTALPLRGVYGLPKELPVTSILEVISLGMQ